MESGIKEKIIRSLSDASSVSYFRSSITGKNVLVVLGNTKSGKSTLIHYLIGNELISYEKSTSKTPSNYTMFKICVNPDAADGPAIGQESTSCTATPKIYPIPNTDTVAVDMPGFEDNRGVEQDITNTLYFSQIKAARTVKFVLVVDVNEILCDNIRNFTNSLSYLQHLLNNFDVLKNSICAIFMKDRQKHDGAELADVLKAKILDQDKLAMDKILVGNFYENQNLIGVFRMPTKKGPVTENLDVNVKGAIKTCQQVDVEECNLSYSFSDKARKALLEIYPEYTDSNFFTSQTDRIVSDFDNFLIDKYVYASYTSELTETNTALTEIVTNLKRHKQLPYDSLSDIVESLDQLNRVQDNFRSNFRCIELLDQSGLLEARYKDIIRRNYISSLDGIIDKTERLIEKVQAELDTRKEKDIYYDFKQVDPATSTLAAVTTVMALAGDAIWKFLMPYTVLEDRVGSLPAAAIATAASAGTANATKATLSYFQGDIDNRQRLREEQGRSVENVALDIYQNYAYKNTFSNMLNISDDGFPSSRRNIWDDDIPSSRRSITSRKWDSDSD